MYRYFGIRQAAPLNCSRNINAVNIRVEDPD
jgi:hypothetical protein